MKTVSIQPGKAETMGLKRQAKPKEESGGEFRDMLSGAMRTGSKTAETEKAKPEKQNVSDTEPRTKKARTEEPDELLNQEAAMSATARAAQLAQAAEPETETPEAETGAVEDVLLSVQPAAQSQYVEAVETIQTAPLESEASEAVETVLPEVQAETQTTVRQSVSREIPEMEKRSKTEAITEQPETERTQSAGAPETRREARAHTEAPAVTRETAEDAAPARAVDKRPETAQTEGVRPVIKPPDEDDPRLGEMLANASKKLEQGRTATETHEETEVPVLEEAAKGQEPPKAEAATDASTDAGSDTEAGEEKPADNPDIAKETAPKFNHRPLREETRTDDAVFDIVQPKPDVTVPEARPGEPVPEAHPVRVPEQAEQIRARVIESLEEQKLEFEMQLNPRELGRVDVKMVLESGKLAMEIAAASPKSTELLSKQVDSLIASLRLNGVDISSVNVVTARQDVDGYMAQQGNAYDTGASQSQTGGRQERDGRDGTDGAGHDGADYPEAQADEMRGGPKKLLNYSV